MSNFTKSNIVHRSWKVKDVSKMKEAMRKRWSDPDARRRLTERMIGNQNAKGKHWKLSKDALVKRFGRPGYALGKHWKVKDTSKVSQSRKGMKFSEKHRRAISRAMSGANSPFWRGGVSSEAYTISWTTTLKRSIRERDYYTCQECHTLQKDHAFSIHHIDYNKKNCNPANLITLCMSCHAKTNTNREKWLIHFEHYKMIDLSILNVVDNLKGKDIGPEQK